MKEEINSSGFIKLDRNILNWEWYQNSNTKDLFIHCLLKANHTDKKWQGKLIKRGSFITSYDTLSRELGISMQSIRTSVNKLKLTGELTSQSTSRNTLLIINNYEDYQSTNKLANKQSTNNQQTTNKQLTTTKELKKEKKEKKEDMDFTIIKSWWNNLPYGLAQVQMLSDKRKSSIRNRIKEIGSEELFMSQVQKAIDESEFLRGATGWKADFDFILQQKSFIKMIEGGYKQQTKEQQHISKMASIELED